jgi:hypothetical protein
MGASSLWPQGMTFPWGKGLGNGCGLGETFVLPKKWPFILAMNKRFLKKKQQDDKFIHCVTSKILKPYKQCFFLGKISNCGDQNKIKCELSKNILEKNTNVTI